MNKVYKVYREKKYSNKEAKVTKKAKHALALATSFGAIVIVALNLIPFNIAKADDEVTTNQIYVEVIDNGDAIDFKNVDYPAKDNDAVIKNTEKVLDPFNVGSSPDKKMVIDYLASPEGQLIYKYAEQYGVDPKRLTAGGRGEYNPVAPNDTEVGKQRNRRTQIIITPKLDQFMDLIDKAPDAE